MDKLLIRNKARGSKVLRVAFALIAMCVLAFTLSCSSNGGSEVQTASDTENTDDTESTDVAAEILPADNGELLPVLLPTNTELDLEYARSGVDLIDQLNEAFILPADIDVFFADCGTANAFYVPPSFSANDIVMLGDMQISAGGSIFICHELSNLFASFFNEKDQAVGASIFVLLHELGHALVNQLELPVLGIEESYVDGMAAVFLGEAGLAEGSVLAGWFFGSQPETPFFDSHRAGPQRLGDLACWGVGADPALLQDDLIDSIATQLIQQGGRNCAAEYLQQREALETVLGPHLRVGLSEIFTDPVALF